MPTLPIIAVSYQPVLGYVTMMYADGHRTSCRLSCLALEYLTVAELNAVLYAQRHPNQTVTVDGHSTTRIA